MSKLTRFGLISLSTLSLLFACENLPSNAPKDLKEDKGTISSASPSSVPSSSPSSSSASTDDVFATKVRFKAFLESCIINSSNVPEDLREASKKELASMDNAKDEAWPALVVTYKMLYSKYVDTCNASSSPAPSSSATPVASPVASPSTTELKVTTTFGELSCDQEGKIKSGSGKSIDLKLTNNTGKSIKIYWLDGNGKRIAYNKNLLDKATFTQQTFITHPWLIADSDDKCIKILAPDASGTIDIK